MSKSGAKLGPECSMKGLITSLYVNHFSLMLEEKQVYQTEFLFHSCLLIDIFTQTIFQVFQSYVLSAIGQVFPHTKLFWAAFKAF